MVILKNVELQVKLPISDHIHIKDHVNTVNVTIWSLYMFQCHIIMTQLCSAHVMAILTLANLH